ncbi:MAG: uracil-DNA glycosylase [Sulfuricaulis sp.]
MNELIETLAEFTAPNVFNPWRDADPLDIGAGHLHRQLRLARHFNVRPRILLIGEAPGYQGCHFSGVPFTNEKLILEGEIPRVHATGRLTKRERPWCEPSATIVWRTLHDLDLADEVVLWNAFAWHPYKDGNPMSNRAPTRAELEAGKPVLTQVLAHFEGVPIVPVGRVAEKLLAILGVETLAPVRHPSMGGAHDFYIGMMNIARKQA